MAECAVTECAECMEAMRVPTTLACGHTLCIVCVDRLTNAMTNSVQCPQCYRSTNIPDGGLAKNVTAEAFFQLWSKHADFDSEINIKAFLYTTIRNNCIHYLRHLREDPDAKGYALETSFSGAPPKGVVQELLDYIKDFGKS